MCRALRSTVVQRITVVSVLLVSAQESVRSLLFTIIWLGVVADSELGSIHLSPAQPANSSQCCIFITIQGPFIMTSWAVSIVSLVLPHVLLTPCRCKNHDTLKMPINRLRSLWFTISQFIRVKNQSSPWGITSCGCTEIQCASCFTQRDGNKPHTTGYNLTHGYILNLYCPILKINKKTWVGDATKILSNFFMVKVSKEDTAAWQLTNRSQKNTINTGSPEHQQQRHEASRPNGGGSLIRLRR